MVAEKKAATEELKTALQSPLTLSLAAVTAVVVVYALISGVVEPVVGAAAGAAAGVAVLQSQWEKEERTGIAVVVTAVAGGVAGALAAMLRSLVAARSLTGAAVIGAIAGAAIVAIAKPQLLDMMHVIQKLIIAFKLFIGTTLIAILNLAIDAVKWVKDIIKCAVSKIKTAVQWITKAVQKLFNTLLSFGAPGIAAIGVGILGSVALSSAAVSGLAALGTAIAGLFGGLLGLGIVFAAGAAVFVLYRRGQSNQQQTQGAEMVLPIIVLLLFVLFCFLVSSLGVWRFCCLLLFLSLFLWFVLGNRSERH
ncbi:uncharacterized protein [Garra rufa]|uniref:uncharacterized protein n=1 Tax=Garra rufa TaxID=137080 RepID=UPI003CCED7A2